MKRLAILILMLLAFIMVGITSVINLYENNNNTTKNTENFIDRVDSILSEARQAAAPLKNIYDGKCNEYTQRALAHQAQLYPHISAIHLYREGKVYCSSLMTTFLLAKPQLALREESLYLLPEMPFFPGVPVLLYTLGDKESGVAITINGYWFSRKNAALSIDGKLLVDGRVLDEAATPFTIAPRLISTLFNYEALSLDQNTGASTLGLKFALFLSISGFLITSCLIWHCYRLMKDSGPKCLLRAIQAGEIVPYYQPIRDGISDKLYGAEILARWKKPDGMIIPPDIFIPQAEKYGLIVPLTRSLLQQAEYDLMTLLLRLPQNFHISLNISISDETVSELLNELIYFQQAFTGRVRLVVELTERLAAEPDDEMIAMLQRLRAAGIHIALDDFGTGYSSLNWLERIPADIIKIDKIFMDAVVDKTDAPLMVNDIINIAKKRNIKLIAEGIESDYQHQYLNSRSVALQQGYFWSVPLSSQGFARYLIWDA